jgi:16S rRNA (adenine1518-N6/adenine1519-N6)-dimethyltransferase
MRDCLKHITLKKKYGQHFLKDTRYLNEIVHAVTLDDSTSVFEIGGGAGALTRAILQQAIARLWVFEIDPDWAVELRRIQDARLSVFEENFLDIDAARFNEHKPWTLLANLPYQITFPILYFLQRNRHMLSEGVIMVQEEVAHKLLKTSGRDYGYTSLFFQRYFDWKKMSLVPPEAFYPMPKVHSRLLYLKPKHALLSIDNEEYFWQFIKICFKQPRRTLRNNLKQAHYAIDVISSEVLDLRAQQLAMNDFLGLWKLVQQFFVV